MLTDAVAAAAPGFAQELLAFLSTSTTSQLVVDRSPQNELLKMNFNIRCGRDGAGPSGGPCLTAAWAACLVLASGVACCTRTQIWQHTNPASAGGSGSLALMHCVPYCRPFAAPSRAVRSFPALSCEFATVDVSDALGTVSPCGAHGHRMRYSGVHAGGARS